MRALISCCAGLLMLLLASCGGGGGGSGTPAALRVTSSNIPNGAIGVALEPTLFLTFNTPIAGGGFRPDQVRLRGPAGTVSSSVRFSGQEIIVTLQDSLKAKTAYTLTVSAGARADDGSVLQADHVLSFRTQAAVFDSRLLVPAEREFNTGQGTLVAMGSLNGDARNDLVFIGRLLNTADSRVGGYTLRLYRQLSNGSVELFQQIDHRAGSTCMDGPDLERATILNVDADAQPEIVVAQSFFANADCSGLQVFKRASDGQFRAQPLMRSLNAQFLFQGDIDRDGRQDFIGATVANSNNEASYQVSLNTASGLVAKPAVNLARMGVPEFALGDMDRDGRNELLIDFPYPTGTGTPPSLTVFSQGASGEFSRNMALTQAVETLCPPPSATCERPQLFDINNDQMLDLMFAQVFLQSRPGEPAASPFIRQPNGSFAAAPPLFLNADELRVVDLDNDARQDVFILGFTSGANGSFFAAAGMGQGREDFEYSSRYPLPIAASQISSGSLDTGDFDGDGFIDALVSGENTGVLLVSQRGR